MPGEAETQGEWRGEGIPCGSRSASSLSIDAEVSHRITGGLVKAAAGDPKGPL